jgi:hypothetical protein
MHPLRISWLLALLALPACGGIGTLPSPAAQRAAIQAPAAWVPAAGTSYQIQYDGTVDLRVPAQVYDLDAFDTAATTVTALHARGRHAVCYVDVGTWENWRPDAGEFPKSVLGRRDGPWPGERWLDIRQTAILEPIMANRFALCKQKGFDAVDPDNIDGYTNDTGFPLTAADQLAYDTWVAEAVHSLGLSVAQKNDPGQIARLFAFFDFGVVEQCFAQRWCGTFARYSRANRLVVDVEYGLSKTRFLSKTCRSDAKYHETAILKHLSLNAWIVNCGRADGAFRNSF